MITPSGISRTWRALGDALAGWSVPSSTLTGYIVKRRHPQRVYDLPVRTAPMNGANEREKIVGLERVPDLAEGARITAPFRVDA